MSKDIRDYRVTCRVPTALIPGQRLRRTLVFSVRAECPEQAVLRVIRICNLYHSDPESSAKLAVASVREYRPPGDTDAN